MSRVPIALLALPVIVILLLSSRVEAGETTFSTSSSCRRRGSRCGDRFRRKTRSATWCDWFAARTCRSVGCRSSAPYEKADHALTIRNANNFKLRNVEVFWDKPESPKWKSALEVEAVKGLAIEGFAGRQARLADSVPAIVLRQVEGVILRGCTAPAGTAEFVHVAGAASRSIQLIANDLREARAAFGADGDVRKDEIRSTGDLLRKD